MHIHPVLRLRKDGLQLFNLFFRMENKTVTVLIPREQVQVSQGEAFLGRTFGGSLPGFIAAFAREKRLSAKDIAEIRRLIDDYEEKNGHA